MDDPVPDGPVPDRSAPVADGPALVVPAHDDPDPDRPDGDPSVGDPPVGDPSHGDPPDGVLDHDGPWSEEDYRTLSAEPVAHGDGRAELIDGVLLVGPGPTTESARAVAHARSALDGVLPDGLCVLDAAPVRMGPDCVLVPDLVVTRAPADGTSPALVVEADEVLMVVEILGPEHGALDRAFKPQVYARSRVPYLLLLDHDAPYAAASMVIGGRYHEYVRASGAEDLELEEPFRLRLPPPPAPPRPIGSG